MKIGKRLADDITTLIVLITETVDDLDSGEQKALRRVASVIDRIKNRQTLSNPFLPRNSIKRACTGEGHGKDCFCRGDGVAVEPVGGWSTLASLVDERRRSNPGEGFARAGTSLL